MVNRKMFRRFLDHPARHWATIIVVLGLILTVVLPAADELSRSRQDRIELEEFTAHLRREVADLEPVRRKTREQLDDLHRLEDLTVKVDQIPQVRQQIVDWAREAGCQVRRIRLEPPRSQAWHEGDTLAELTTAKRSRFDSPYRLMMQPLSVSVSGTLSKVKQLLTELHSTPRLLQCQDFSLAPSRENRKEVVLEIDLMLIDLVRDEILHN